MSIAARRLQRGVTHSTAPNVSDILVPKTGAWWGVYAGGTAAANTTFENDVAGRGMDVVTYYFSTANSGPSSQVTLDMAAGRIPCMTVTSKNNSTGTYQSWADIAAGTYDAYWRGWGTGLAALTGKVMFTFDHEAATKINQWADMPDKNPAHYIAAFRHIHDLIAPLAPNVVWTWWAAGIQLAQEDTLYPGDAYCDWVGWDPYKYSSHAAGETALTTFTKFASHMDSQGYGVGKPRALFETGCDTVTFANAAYNTAAWWADVPAAAEALNLRLIVLFDRDNSNGSFVIDATVPDVMTAYRASGADPYFNQPHS